MSDTINAFLARWAVACAVLLGVTSLGANAYAQGVPGAPAPTVPAQSAPAQPNANPMCVRLEGQLATIDRGGGGDPARAEQLRRYEDAASKQQAELDRVTSQAKRMGCDSSGFFSMFNGQSQQCGPVNNQIQQMRGNLDQITSNLERLRVGTPGSSDRDSQRRSVLLALGQNNCGPQYAAAARSPAPGSGPGNFLNNLFGNNEPTPDAPPPLDGAAAATSPSGTYRTVCVRSCDGAYFPISFATVQSRFADDERTCKNQCPAAEATLFSYRNPGEDMNSAVSISGQPYTSSPNAFKYRTEFNPSCSCKAQGQTWSDALKNIDDKAAAENGDIIVTEERARKMSLPPAKGTPASARKGAAPAPAPAVAAPTNTPAAAATPADPNKPIRSVGPTFIPAK
ncbi:MAG: hypothetical protein JWQ94_4501 [Tardiphaga sp.]|nr:hypothetical protein [Tardiphaga sp.]